MTLINKQVVEGAFANVSQWFSWKDTTYISLTGTKITIRLNCLSYSPTQGFLSNSRVGRLRSRSRLCGTLGRLSLALPVVRRFSWYAIVGSRPHPIERAFHMSVIFKNGHWLYTCRAESIGYQSQTVHTRTDWCQFRRARVPSLRLRRETGQQTVSGVASGRATSPAPARVFRPTPTEDAGCRGRQQRS